MLEVDHFLTAELRRGAEHVREVLRCFPDLSLDSQHLHDVLALDLLPVKEVVHGHGEVHRVM